MVSLVRPTLRAATGLQMLAYQIDGQPQPDRQATRPSPCALRIRIRAARGGFAELAGVLQARSRPPFVPVPGLEDTPLCLHAAYGARESHGCRLAYGRATRAVPGRCAALTIARPNCCSCDARQEQGYQTTDRVSRLPPSAPSASIGKPRTVRA